MKKSTKAIRSILAANGFKLEVSTCHDEPSIRVTRLDNPEWHYTMLVGERGEEWAALQTAGWAIACWEDDAWMYEEDKL